MQNYWFVWYSYASSWFLLSRLYPEAVDDDDLCV